MIWFVLLLLRACLVQCTDIIVVTESDNGTTSNIIAISSGQHDRDDRVRDVTALDYVIVAFWFVFLFGVVYSVYACYVKSPVVVERVDAARPEAKGLVGTQGAGVMY